jgi:hypothetical protein
MGRGAVGALGAAVGLGLLSGCSPASLPLVAVWMSQDGKPVARVQPCSGDHASSVTLHSWEERESGGTAATPSGGTPDSGWDMWSSARIGRTTFALFSPPSSWHVDTNGTQALLPGRTYYLSFFGPRGGKAYDGYVYFTAADLASLGPGRVWADERAMTRDEFTELVDDSC